MNKPLISFAAALAFACPAFAQNEAEVAHPSPNEIVEQATPEEWVRIAPENLLVMTLAPDMAGNPRRVVMQLMPAPFSQGWIENIRTLARAQYYDGLAVIRVQDNYVTQWGDPATAEESAKPLPEGLKVMEEQEYVATGLLAKPDPRGHPRINYKLGAMMVRNAMIASGDKFPPIKEDTPGERGLARMKNHVPKLGDNYASLATLLMGWPIAGMAGQDGTSPNRFWPVHCYGMIGVARGMSPSTGDGSSLYTVIGHAPRHLDRNIALVGRVIEGMAHLSALPRGSGRLGFYTEDEAARRTPIQSVRIASDLSETQRPAFEYLSTQSATFAKYAEARANRRDPFFIHAAGGADICNIPVPVRRATEE